MGIYLFPDAQSFPAVEVVGDGCIGREVFGQVSPRAACGEDVEDGVEDVAWVVFGLGSVDALGQEWLDELPLLVGETELVGVVCCVHREFFSTFLLPVYALTGAFSLMLSLIIWQRTLKILSSEIEPDDW